MVDPYSSLGLYLSIGGFIFSNNFLDPPVTSSLESTRLWKKIAAREKESQERKLLSGQLGTSQIKCRSNIWCAVFLGIHFLFTAWLSVGVETIQAVLRKEKTHNRLTSWMAVFPLEIVSISQPSVSLLLRPQQKRKELWCTNFLFLWVKIWTPVKIPPSHGLQEYR